LKLTFGNQKIISTFAISGGDNLRKKTLSSVPTIFPKYSREHDFSGL